MRCNCSDGNTTRPTRTRSRIRYLALLWLGLGLCLGEIGVGLAEANNRLLVLVLHFGEVVFPLQNVEKRVAEVLSKDQLQVAYEGEEIKGGRE